MSIFKSEELTMDYTLKTDKMTFTVRDRGAELISAIGADGEEFLWGANPEIWGEHSPVLFPLCGRLFGGCYTYRGKRYEMGCHGFYSSSLPTLTERTDASLTFVLTENEDTLKVYPFPFCIRLTYTANSDTLTVSALIENTGEDILPFMYGAHPSFAVPMDKGLSFEDFKVDLGDGDITLYREQNGPFVCPIGEKFQTENGVFHLNNDEICSYGTVILSGVGGKVSLCSDKSSRSVALTFSDDFKYFCIWKSNAEGASYLCLEPWSGVPGDGATDECFETRGSMVRLMPGEKKHFVYTMKFSY